MRGVNGAREAQVAHGLDAAGGDGGDDEDGGEQAHVYPYKRIRRKVPAGALMRKLFIAIVAALAAPAGAPAADYVALTVNTTIGRAWLDARRRR